ncbi:MAG: tRNA (adenosine(37)-N6)-threonylcarbamoyltransferase complex dimerization subunit type 1 TsaB [Pirellulales bacterium]
MSDQRPRTADPPPQPTRIVAFESATQPGSIALLAGPQLVHSAPLDPRVKTTRQFTRALHDGLELLHWQPADVGLLAVCRGPGSFTGLRIAITLAKLWAYAHTTPVVALSTLQLIAHQLPHDPTATHAAVCLDGQRQQWFAAVYEHTDDGWVEAEAPAVVGPQEWLNRLTKFPRCWLTGPGLDQQSTWVIPPSLQLAPSECRAPQAPALGRLALEFLQRGATDDPWGLVPVYLRPSAAEERRGVRL